MPSYRVTMTIGMLRPGVAPERVLPTATDAAAELVTVEASDIGIVAGSPRITVRFEAEDAEIAGQVAGHVAAATDTVAEMLTSKLTVRDGGRWYVVQ